MKNRKSIRMMILIPVLLLGVVSIVSNILAWVNLGKVNGTASKIADEYMVAITKLDTIGQTTKDIHTLALSHIVATDFETMTSVISQIDSEEKALEETIADYSRFTTTNSQSYYEKMLEDYQTFRNSIKILLAQSANQKTKEAYATANGEVADSAKLLGDDIDAIITSFSEDSTAARAVPTAAIAIPSMSFFIVFFQINISFLFFTSFQAPCQYSRCFEYSRMTNQTRREGSSPSGMRVNWTGSTVGFHTACPL